MKPPGGIWGAPYRATYRAPYRAFSSGQDEKLFVTLSRLTEQRVSEFEPQGLANTT